MNKPQHRCAPATLALLLALGAALPSAAMAAPANDWCRVDDPATWRATEGKSCQRITAPQELPDALVLPLPCGRQSVLQKVVVPASSVLDHAPIWLGSMSDEGAGSTLNQVVNGPRQSALAGGFSVDARGRPVARTARVDWSKLAGRAYYIAKYELPEHHWQLYKDGLFDTTVEHDTAACADYDAAVAKLNERRIAPASGLSWYDAVAFTQAWSNWLMALDRARVPAKTPYLPWEQGTPSYVRLPTEAEWEFAARGGVARQEDALLTSYLVRDGASDGSRPGTLEEVAVRAEVGGSRRNPADAIGTKLPNLLGLHDMIGNVDEIVFDLFQLVRPDVPHGQSGGYVVKGGNVFTSVNSLGVSHRREVPFFDLRGESRSTTTGFRPLLALPVFVSAISQKNRWETGLQNPKWMEALEAARQQIVQSSDQDRADIAARLQQLQEEAADGRVEVGALQTSLGEIQSSLERSNTQLNERSREVLRERVQTVALVGANINSLGRNILGSRLEFERFHEDFTEEQRRPYQPALNNLEKALKADEQNLDAAFSYYVSTILTLAREPAPAVDEAIASVRDQLRRQQLAAYESYIALAETHVAEVRRNNGNVSQPLSAKWLVVLDSTRERRVERFGR